MRIKIYSADVRELENAELFRYFYHRVSPERRAKTDRMVFDKDKRLSLGAGVLLEHALAAENVTAPALTAKHNDKPCLAGREDIMFNLSHSGTKVLCAVSDHEIGCDVEQIRDMDMMIAKRFFYADEYRALMGCKDSENRLRMFFRFWTLKESFMKATGLGLEAAPDSFCIDLSEDNISIRQRINRKRYYFREYHLNESYCCAVCSEEKPDIPHGIISYSFSSGAEQLKALAPS